MRALIAFIKTISVLAVLAVVIEGFGYINEHPAVKEAAGVTLIWLVIIGLIAALFTAFYESGGKDNESGRG
jgi:hypothetical protein